MREQYVLGRKKMSEEKRNRIAGAITVNVILLVAIIFCSIIYQIVESSLLNARRVALIEEINYYKQQIEQGESALDYYQSSDYLLLKAYEYGYVFPNDK